MARPRPFGQKFDPRAVKLVAEHNGWNEQQCRQPYVVPTFYDHDEKNDDDKRENEALLVQIRNKRHDGVEQRIPESAVDEIEQDDVERVKTVKHVGRSFAPGRCRAGLGALFEDPVSDVKKNAYDHDRTKNYKTGDGDDHPTATSLNK